MNESDPTAYAIGRLLGGPLFVAIIGYIIIRVTKKRNPIAKEWVIIAVIAVVLVIATAAMRVSQQLG